MCVALIRPALNCRGAIVGLPSSVNVILLVTGPNPAAVLALTDTLYGMCLSGKTNCMIVQLNVPSPLSVLDMIIQKEYSPLTYYLLSHSLHLLSL